MAALAKVVREYVASNPVVSGAMRLGITNNSAVARLIARDLDIKDLEAVRAACRRIPRVPPSGRPDRSLGRLLRRCRIHTRTRVATVTISAGVVELRVLAEVVAGLLRDDQVVRLVQGARTAVLIVDEDETVRLTSRLTPAQVLGVKRDLTEVTVTGPEELQRIPGVVALLTNALALQGVNILQGLLFPVDMIFLVANADLTKAVDGLDRVLHRPT